MCGQQQGRLGWSSASGRPAGTCGGEAGARDRALWKADRGCRTRSSRVLTAPWCACVSITPRAAEGTRSMRNGPRLQLGRGRPGIVSHVALAMLLSLSEAPCSQMKTQITAVPTSWGYCGVPSELRAESLRAGVGSSQRSVRYHTDLCLSLDTDVQTLERNFRRRRLETEQEKALLEAQETCVTDRTAYVHLEPLLRHRVAWVKSASGDLHASKTE